MNLVIEKTNKKMNDLLNQNIVLEAQLQCVVEINKQLKDELTKLSKKKE